ncbi:CHAT domain-containing protein [Dactylosporangium vinaceum]|nr:CHAT domain-containing protein [Dactylosporangium vinaceum]
MMGRGPQGRVRLAVSSVEVLEPVRPGAGFRLSGSARLTRVVRNVVDGMELAWWADGRVQPFAPSTFAGRWVRGGGVFRFTAAAGHPSGVWDTFDGVVLDGEPVVHIVHVLGARAVVAYVRAVCTVLGDDPGAWGEPELPDGALPNAAPESALDVDFPFYRVAGTTERGLALAGRLVLSPHEGGRFGFTLGCRDEAGSAIVLWNGRDLERAGHVRGARISVTARREGLPDFSVDGRRIRFDEASLDFGFEPGEHRVGGVLTLGDELRLPFAGVLRGRDVQRLRERIARPDAAGPWVAMLGAAGAVGGPARPGAPGPALVMTGPDTVARLAPALDLLVGVGRVDGGAGFQAWRRAADRYPIQDFDLDDRDALRFLGQDLAVAGRAAEAAPLMRRAAALLAGGEPDPIGLALLLNHQVNVAFATRDYPGLLEHLRAAVVMRGRLSSAAMVQDAIRPIARTLEQAHDVLGSFAAYLEAAAQRAPAGVAAAYPPLTTAVRESLDLLAELHRRADGPASGPDPEDAAAIGALADGLARAPQTLSALADRALAGGAGAVAAVAHLVAARDRLIGMFANGRFAAAAPGAIEDAEARFLDAVHRDAAAVPGLDLLLRVQMETGVAVHSAAFQVAESSRYLTRADPLAALADRRGGNRDGAARLAGYVEQWRGLLDQDRDRILAVEGALEFYDALVGLLLQLGAVEEALVAAELARARATADLLGAPDAAAPAPGVAEIRATVARLGHCAVEYFVRPDELVTWVIRPDGEIRCHRHPVPTGPLRDAVAELDRLIERRTGCAAGEVAAVEAAITGLLDRLGEHVWRPVAPLLPDHGPVTVIPHLFLLRVPFAALPDRAGGRLIERRALTTVPALSLVDRLLDRRRPDARAGGLLALVDPEPMPKPGLAPLAWTRRHFGDVAALFPAAGRDVRTGAAASYAALREAGPAAGVVFLATHAEAADGARPAAESYVALAPSDAHDGRLGLDDIAGLGLDSPLVVLSACHSGAGPVTGDGVLGVSRAFLVEGAGALLLTQHRVVEEAALGLAYGFLERWRAGARTDEALRAALCDLLADFADDTAMWLPFTLYGTGD